MQVLASIGDYLFPRAFPIIPVAFLAFVLVWLIAGSYLTRRALQKLTTLPRRQTTMARCIRFNFLATGAGLAGGGVTAVFFLVLLRESLGDRMAVVFALAGVPVMLAMAWLAGMALLDAPSAVVRQIILRTTGVLLGFGLALGGVSAIACYYLRQQDLRDDTCLANLRELGARLEKETNVGHEVPSLESLLGKAEGPSVLHCPGRPDLAVGYIYLSTTKGTLGTDRLAACDHRGSHGGQRTVLYSDFRRALQISESEFQGKLKLPENADFAKQVAKEDGK